MEKQGAESFYVLEWFLFIQVLTDQETDDLSRVLSKVWNNRTDEG